MMVEEIQFSFIYCYLKMDFVFFISLSIGVVVDNGVENSDLLLSFIYLFIYYLRSRLFSWLFTYFHFLSLCFLFSVVLVYDVFCSCLRSPLFSYTSTLCCTF